MYNCILTRIIGHSSTIQGVPVLKVHIYIFELKKNGVKNYINKNFVMCIITE